MGHSRSCQDIEAPLGLMASGWGFRVQGQGFVQGLWSMQNSEP